MHVVAGEKLPIDRSRLDDRVLNYKPNGACVMMDDASTYGRQIFIKLQGIQAIEEVGKRKRKMLSYGMQDIREIVKGQRKLAMSEN